MKFAITLFLISFAGTFVGLFIESDWLTILSVLGMVASMLVVETI